MITTEYLLDTNIFNWVCDEPMRINKLPEGRYYVSDWQLSEILRTSDQNKREKLLNTFQEIAPKKEKAMSTPWYSPWYSPWHQGGKYFSTIRGELKNNRGRDADAVNIELCIYKGFVFVSADKEALKVAITFKINVYEIQYRG